MKHKLFHRLTAALCTLLLLLGLTPTAFADDSELNYYPLNPDFGTYLGTNEDGVHLFEITVPANENHSTRYKPTLPAPFYSYHEIVETNPNGVISFDAGGFWGTGCGTATVEYYVRPSRGPHSNDPYKLYVIVHVTVVLKEEFDPSVNKGFELFRPTTASQMFSDTADTTLPDTTTPDTTNPDTSNPSTDITVTLPTAATSTQLYEAGQILGGRSDCRHHFYGAAQDQVLIIAPTCTGYGYIIWHCQSCSAHKVNEVFPPSKHSFGSNGVCTKCGASDPTASTAGSDIVVNPDFGTYIGENKDGVDEFRITLTAGTKETRLPMTSTQRYTVNTLSTDPKVISWDGLTILANNPGTSTLTYKYVINGQEVLKAIVYATVKADDSTSTPAVTGSGMAYSMRNTTLLPRADGGCDLIWTSGVKLVYQDGTVDDQRVTKITTYDANFHEVSSKPIKFELGYLNWAYCGEKYNYLVFSQKNEEQTDNKEVIRIVKFSKNWDRLGSASLYGKASNTSAPFDAANLSFAEAGDMLYVHTAHEMYRTSDGLQHQANMTFSIRQSDMTIPDGRYGVTQYNTGYVSHSFNQDIIVDQAGNIVTLDRGDGYPRAARIFRFNNKAGGDKYTGKGVYVDLKTWPGATGDNETGSETCALAETSQGYLSLYWDTGRGSSATATSPRTLYLAFNSKTNFSNTQTRTVVSGSGSEFVKYAYLFPVSPESGYVLWFTGSDTSNHRYGTNADFKGYYAMYSADGSVGQTVSLGACPGPINGPYYTGKQIVWSSDAYKAGDKQDETMRFGILEGSNFRTVDADGELAGWSGAATETPSTPSTTTPTTNPSTPSTATRFSDVPTSHWAYNAIQTCAANGIVNGVGNGKFNPSGQVTDAQFIAMLTRTFFNDKVEAVTAPAGAKWYYANTKVASDVGLSDGLTVVDTAMSRYNMALLLYNELVLSGKTDNATSEQKENAKTSIKDYNNMTLKQQTWVRYCYALGILTGMSDGTFSGNSSMTRAQACTVIVRMMDLVNG